MREYTFTDDLLNQKNVHDNLIKLTFPNESLISKQMNGFITLQANFNKSF